MTRPDLEPVAEHVLSLVSRHAPAAQALVTVQHLRHGLTRFANSFVHQHVGEDRTGVTLKLAEHDRVLVADTANLDHDALDRFVADAVAHVRLLPPEPDWPGVAGAQDLPDRPDPDPDTWDGDPHRRAAMVERFVAAGRDLSAAGFVDTEAVETVVATSAGLCVRGRTTRATLDAIHQTERSAGFAHATSSAVGDLDAAGAGARAADLARRSADATDLDPGEYEVVLSPDCLAEMVSFLAFYGFNAKEHQEGSSFVDLGEQQFDESVTLVDDATDPRAIGLPFDAEGTAKRRVVLVDAGVSRHLAHDRRTAGLAGEASTGHAIVGGDAWGAFPQNLFVEVADGGRSDLVDGVGRGLLVTSFNYVRILDPKSQVSTGLTRNGTFLIEDGQVTRPVSTLRFTQSFLEALAPGNVVAFGDDARFAACEFGNGLVHCPSVRLRRFRFTGGAAG